jgi:hypothetical protein
MIIWHVKHDRCKETVEWVCSFYKLEWISDTTRVHFTNETSTIDLYVIRSSSLRATCILMVDTPHPTLIAYLSSPDRVEALRV